MELPSKDYDVSKLLFLRCHGLFLFPLTSISSLHFSLPSLLFPHFFPPSVSTSPSVLSSPLSILPDSFLPPSLSLSPPSLLLPPSLSPLSPSLLLPHRVWTMTLATISPSKSDCETSLSGLVDYTYTHHRQYSPHKKQLYCISLEYNALLL